MFSAFTVEFPIDTGSNANRTIPFKNGMSISSNDVYSANPYRNNINSYLTLTGLSPHTEVSLAFQFGQHLDLGSNCFDFLDIIGIRGYEGFTKRLCGGPLLQQTTTATTVGDGLTLRLYTNSEGGGVGFIIVLNGKSLCSDIGIYSSCVYNNKM